MIPKPNPSNIPANVDTNGLLNATDSHRSDTSTIIGEGSFDSDENLSAFMQQGFSACESNAVLAYRQAPIKAYLSSPTVDSIRSHTAPSG